MRDIDQSKIIDFIRTYMENAGFSRLVIGLSGGLDSAVCAYLSKEAIGRDNVYLYNLPYRLSSPESLADAQLVADELGIRLNVFDITPAVDALMAKRTEPDRLRLGNVCARMRMIVLYDFASELDALVVATSNKSEAYLGYTTLWGDMAGAFAPIGDLYKTEEIQLAKKIGIPEKIINKPPTADLWENQTDEGEMGIEYKTADAIFMNIIDKGLSPQMLEGFSQKDIDRALQLYNRNRFKCQMPPSPLL